ncbi:hypothetical protein BDK51DRAFT_47823 [Blyttiomyces helicus]|uniref:Transmembrane protein n=1 Tax=Blyttiomyces helicus TaxID=388810 RepID=A0A4V1IRX0_9FUNG|nr:hypothetical protein BDK51DRAFT_47823 [Blyttiomyces helicus]|eukprot:RKO91527.1 hypothetical protein BDK51DRAFT_47823 [Blyttiomyces helicus]
MKIRPASIPPTPQPLLRKYTMSSEWPPSKTAVAFFTVYCSPILVIWGVYIADLAAYIWGNKDSVVNWYGAPLLVIRLAATSLRLFVLFFSRVLSVYFSSHMVPKTSAFLMAFPIIFTCLVLRIYPLDVCCSHKAVAQDEETAATSIAPAVEPAVDLGLSTMKPESKEEEPQPSVASGMSVGLTLSYRPRPDIMGQAALPPCEQLSPLSKGPRPVPSRVPVTALPPHSEPHLHSGVRPRLPQGRIRASPPAPGPRYRRGTALGRARAPDRVSHASEHQSAARERVAPLPHSPAWQG